METEIENDKKSKNFKNYLAVIIFVVMGTISYFVITNFIEPAMTNFLDSDKQESVKKDNGKEEDNKEEDGNKNEIISFEHLLEQANKIDENIDSDGDGISDRIEYVLEIKRFYTDSDSDGFSDFDELKNGYNPLIFSPDDKLDESVRNLAKKILLAGKNAEFSDLDSLRLELKDQNEKHQNNRDSSKPIFDDKNIICEGQVKDIDGNIYKTVKIGSQCWMAENLNVTKNPVGNSIKRHCCNGCKNGYGGLYTWDTIIDGNFSERNNEKCQGICPNGWHIPTDAEFKKLEMYLGMTMAQADDNYWRGTDQGDKLKVGGSSGFEGIFAGTINKNSKLCEFQNVSAYFWTSSEAGSVTLKNKVLSLSWSHGLRSTHSKVSRNTNIREFAFSVRCIKD